MTTAGNTPNFIASSAVLPFRAVKMVVGTPFSVAHFGDNVPRDALIGVTDGSVRGFRDTFHANSGDPVVLQNSDFVQITCSPTQIIAAGDLLQTDNNGAAIKMSNEENEGVNRAHFVACENASYGEVFWAKRIGAYEERSVQSDLVVPESNIQTQNATPFFQDLNTSFYKRAAALGFAAGFSAYGFSMIVTGSTANSQICCAYLFEGLIKGPAAPAISATVSPATPQVIVASTKTTLGETNAALNSNLIINPSSGWASVEIIGLAATTMRWTISANVAVMGSMSGTF